MAEGRVDLWLLGLHFAALFQFSLLTTTVPGTGVSSSTTEAVGSTAGVAVSTESAISHLNVTSNSSAAASTDNATQTTVVPSTTTKPHEDDDYLKYCPSGVECSKLGGDCITCDVDPGCFYGHTLNVTCTVKPKIVCEGDRNFTRSHQCRYCYQTQDWEQKCTKSITCRSTADIYHQYYRANCTVKDNVLCLGWRRFHKRVRCNWTSGYRWSIALILSVTLGGFGVDRFYLGLWREGIGKLFSFGGLGVWTLVDVILIAIGYVGPADGSLYIF